MDLKPILESILFSAEEPLSPKGLRELLAGALEHSEDPEVHKLKKTSLTKISEALEELAKDHEEAQRSFHLVCIAGSWQFVSRPDYAPWIKALVGHRSRPPRLSQPALETLAIIAYRQPVTRAEIEQVRGVAVDGVMHTLLERDLVVAVGRAEVIGRPMTYATTNGFLEYFGIKDLDELPAADELRRVVVEKPESLLTVDPGLATAPPEQLTMQAEGPSADAQSPDPTAPGDVRKPETVPATETAEPSDETQPSAESEPTENRLNEKVEQAEQLPQP